MSGSIKNRLVKRKKPLHTDLFIYTRSVHSRKQCSKLLLSVIVIYWMGQHKNFPIHYYHKKYVIFANFRFCRFMTSLISNQGFPYRRARPQRFSYIGHYTPEWDKWENFGKSQGDLQPKTFAGAKKGETNMFESFDSLPETTVPCT